MRLIFDIDPDSATPQQRMAVVGAILWKYPPPADYQGTPQRWVREVLLRLITGIIREHAAHLTTLTFAQQIDAARDAVLVPTEVVDKDGLVPAPLPPPGPEDLSITPPETPDLPAGDSP